MHFLYKFKADSEIVLPPFSCPALSSRFTISAMKYAKRSRCGVDSHLLCAARILLEFYGGGDSEGYQMREFGESVQWHF